MSKNNKTLSDFKVFEEMGSLIRENLISEAIRMNNTANFMDSEEFKKKIRCLSNWQIAEITKDIGLWHMNRMFNVSYKDSERDKLKLRESEKIMEELMSRIKRGH
ncbi:hypothetical protein SAMN02745133_02685 [Desulforamulus putei DSM 12395]|uniref:Uncharacterized protein n=1 Tax=Desulforamulus putei DSM 12395 TaxID=1121429 RepID=A0A1M5BSW3_9FIRM|nr:hypothetical protein [Desulforamulus putei]SHF45441.1 hypothetical protein SAMN02745133_02685 [Desulforamulus putei DSM 12395]